MTDSRLERLKREFDDGFAAPPAPRPAAHVGLLVVRVAGRDLALRTAELAGLLRPRRIVPLPAEDPAVIGVAGIRGRVVAVYSLASLLGHKDDAPPEWLVLVGPDPIAWSFARFLGHHQVEQGEITAAVETRGHLAELARISGTVLPVIDVKSLLATTGLRKER
jgi:chemotaxis signal transduction protein